MRIKQIGNYGLYQSLNCYRKKIWIVLFVILTLFSASSQSVLAKNSVEGAIQWAENQGVGDNWDEQCGHVWAYWCLHFMGHCYLEVPPTSGYSTDGSAIIAWNRNDDKYGSRQEGDYNVPRGALVFFNISDDGHVGLSVGDGTMWHAWTDGIRHENISSYGNYLGWRWPNAFTDGVGTNDACFKHGPRYGEPWFQITWDTPYYNDEYIDEIKYWVKRNSTGNHLLVYPFNKGDNTWPVNGDYYIHHNGCSQLHLTGDDYERVDYETPKGSAWTKDFYPFTAPGESKRLLWTMRMSKGRNPGEEFGSYYNVNIIVNAPPNTPGPSSPLENQVVTPGNVTFRWRDRGDADPDYNLGDHKFWGPNPQRSFAVELYNGVGNKIAESGWLYNDSSPVESWMRYIGSPGRYSWDVRAGDGMEDSQQCQRQHFVINSRPNTPVPVSPLENQTVAPGEVNFQWRDQGDPDNWEQPERSFSVEVFNNSGQMIYESGWLYNSSSPITNWSHNLASGNYSWDVRAGDGISDSQRCVRQHFTVSGVPTPSITSISPGRIAAGMAVRITIIGINLNGAETIKLDNENISFSTVDDGHITASLPVNLSVGIHYIKTSRGAEESEQCLFEVLSNKGDLNDDGVFTLLDVNTLMDMILNDHFNDKADMNGDGKADILDAVLLQKKIL